MHPSGAGWTVRGIRGGLTAEPSYILDTYDNDWHVAGFLAKSARVVPFWDGVIFPEFANANLQPSVVCQGLLCHIFTIAAGGVDADMDADWILHGR